MKTSKRNKKLLFFLLFSLSILIFFAYGFSSLVGWVCADYLDKKFHIQVQYDRVHTNGLSRIVFNNLHLKPKQGYLGKISGEVEIPLLEIKYSLWDFVFSGEKLFHDVYIEDLILRTSENYHYQLGSEIKIKGDDQNKMFTILVTGNYRGKFEIAKADNLSWQVDLLSVDQFDALDIWKLEGQLQDHSGGQLILATEWMGKVFKINVKAREIHLERYFKNYQSPVQHEVSADIFIKGDRENLDRFTKNDILYYKNKSLIGNINIKVQRDDLTEKVLVHDFRANYENNILETDYTYAPDASNKIDAKFNMDASNHLSGNFDGTIHSVHNFMLDYFPNLDLSQLQGGVEFTGKVSGTYQMPEVEYQLKDSQLLYRGAPVEVRCEIISSGTKAQVPILQVIHENKIFRCSFDVMYQQNDFLAHVARLEIGRRGFEFKNANIIPISFTKAGILSIDEFRLYTRQAEIRSSLQVLPNGESIGKVFVYNLNVSDFLEFLNFELPYKIEGQTTAELKFSGPITTPSVQLVGAIDDVLINAVAGGNCKYDLQMDQAGITINAFELKHDLEQSNLFVNGYIPLEINLSKGIFSEDIHRERALYFICQNTSIVLLSKIFPKIETLNGKISGEVSSFKLEEKRYLLGNLNLTEGKFSFAGNLAPITDLESTLIFSKEKIEIPKVTGKMGEGIFNIKGSLSLVDLKVSAIDFAITGKKLRLINDDDLEVILSPTLTYTGSLDAPLLKGTLYADYGNYTENLNKLTDKIQTLKNPSNEFGFWPRTELDLEVRCDHKVFNSIKQTSFFLQGSANLKFKGFIANSYMSGLVRVEKGVIPIFSKEFVVEGGSVVFEENAAPYVNLVANYRGNNIDVKMQVNQSLDEPLEPIYSSLPALTDEEIQRYLMLNLLPGEEGENIDLRSFIKTIADYSDILSNESLKWLKRFSFETRTRNRSGQEELGLTIEYKFDQPEWFSVKAIQDDNGVFNFFLVASKSFLGYYVDPSLFTSENFLHLDSKQISDFTAELLKMEDLNIPIRKSNEFDIQYLVNVLNFLINRRDLVDHIKDRPSNTEIKIVAFQNNLESHQDFSEREKLKKIRKFNRDFITEVYKKYFEHEESIVEEEAENVQSKLKGKGLNSRQKYSLRKLVKDEFKSYVALNDVSFLTSASNKMQRVCADWGYHDAQVKWEKNEQKFLDEQRTIHAVKFIVHIGQRYRFKEIRAPEIPTAEFQDLVKEIRFEPHKTSAPVYYSAKYVSHLVNQIIQYYMSLGYLDVKVEASEPKFINEKRKDVLVEFYVKKGKVYYVDSFELFGQEVFSKDEILNSILPMMKEQGVITGNTIEDEVFHDVLLSKIRKLISEFYKSRGYYYVEVTNRVKTAYEFKSLIDFETSFTGDLKSIQKELYGGIKPLEDLFPVLKSLKETSEYYQFFNSLVSSTTLRWTFLQNFVHKEDWKNEEIKQLYVDVKKDRDEVHEQILMRKIFKELYGFNETKVFANKESAASSIRLAIVCQIKEHQQYRFGKSTYAPRYADQFKTNRKIIAKQITFKEGEIYDIRKVRETVRKLTRLGVFQEVEYNETVVDGVVMIDFILRESKTINMQVEGGYGEFDGFQGGIRLFDNNIFGTTRSLGVRGYISERSLLVEPVFDTDFFLGFRNEWIGFYEHSKKEDFTLERIGFETNLHRNFKKYFGALLGYKFENTTAKNLVEELNQLKEGYVNFSGIQMGLSYINIDDFLMPHRGTFFKWRAEYNTKVLGSTFDFFKTEIQVTKHLPISERVTLSLGARFGWIKSLDSNVNIPIQSRFFSGGGTTVRGYEYNSLGPKIDQKNIGGEIRGILNSEFRFPLSFYTIKHFGVIFFDTGFLEESFDHIDDPTFYSAIGVGYRYLSPIGPIRLDLGLALDDKRDSEEGVDLNHRAIKIDSLYINHYRTRLHLSFGFAF